MSDAKFSGECGDIPNESDLKRTLIRYKVGESLAKEGFGDVHVLSPDAADRALTPARREIIAALAEEDVRSLRDLAERMGRSPGNLSRDLKVLIGENLVRYEEDGRAKRPVLKHDTIIVEPLVASTAPLPEDVLD